MLPSPRRVQRVYYALVLGNTLAASFIWGINTLFLLDAGLTNFEAFAHDGPVLVDVVCDPQELTIPPSIAFEQAKGFALYAIRTVLSGRGDELLDLARTNWRQLF